MPLKDKLFRCMKKKRELERERNSYISLEGEVRCGVCVCVCATVGVREGVKCK